MSLLRIRNLSVDFATASGQFRAVDQVDQDVDTGEILAIVGESGSGKSVSMLAMMGLLPWTATVTADEMTFDGHNLLTMDATARRKIVGNDLAMIFQEPMSSLNPCFPVGWQIKESLRVHLGLNRKQQHARAIELFEQVGIPDPEKRLWAFPHQMSGGMNQRVMIAMAIACKPKLLIADEPTTALDVTIQAQILDLLASLRDETGMGLVLITHDMGVVAETAERVSVQYAGQKIEEQQVIPLFDEPHHPYTNALLDALPERATEKRLPTIPGVVPGQFDRPAGCLFSPRCKFADAKCKAQSPAPQSDDLGRARCFYPLNSNERQSA